MTNDMSNIQSRLNERLHRVHVIMQLSILRCTQYAMRPVNQDFLNSTYIYIFFFRTSYILRPVLVQAVKGPGPAKKRTSEFSGPPTLWPTLIRSKNCMRRVLYRCTRWPPVGPTGRRETWRHHVVKFDNVARIFWEHRDLTRRLQGESRNNRNQNITMPVGPLLKAYLTNNQVNVGKLLITITAYHNNTCCYYRVEGMNLFLYFFFYFFFNKIYA